MAIKKGLLNSITETEILAATDTVATKKYSCDIRLSNQHTSPVTVLVKIAGNQWLSATLGKQFEASSNIESTNFTIENPEIVTVTAGVANVINYRLSFYELEI